MALGVEEEEQVDRAGNAGRNQVDGGAVDGGKGGADKVDDGGEGRGDVGGWACKVVYEGQQDELSKGTLRKGLVNFTSVDDGGGGGGGTKSV